MNTPKALHDIYSTDSKTAQDAAYQLQFADIYDHAKVIQTLNAAATKAREFDLRKISANSLINLKPKAALKLFSQAAGSQENQIRVNGLFALGLLGNPDALSVIGESFHHENFGIFKSAVIAVGKIGRNRNSVEILEGLNRNHFLPPFVLQAVNRSIRNIATRIAYEESAFPSLHKFGIKKLQELNADNALDTFKRSTRNEDPAKRCIAYKNIGVLADKRGASTVIHGFADHNISVKKEAIIAAGKIGSNKYIISQLLKIIRGFEPPEIKKVAQNARKAISNRINGNEGSSTNATFAQPAPCREQSYTRLAF